jgi:hypothetical protein
VNGFELSLNEEVYEYGDEVIATLVNTSDEEKSTGAKGKIDIQYKDDGWNTIFGKPANEDFVDPLILASHSPGEGWEWGFTLTEEALSELNLPGAPTVKLYQELKTGEYRFVYWDLEGDDRAIGVRFSIEGT